ncbi:MAG: hypothetical protein U0269_36615 [Polyangiales bacterium]
MKVEQWLRSALSAVLFSGCAVGVGEERSTNIDELPRAVIRGDFDRGSITIATDFIGHYSASTGRLTFTRGLEAHEGVVRPGYTQASPNVVSLADNGSAVFGETSFSGGMCAADQLCARVTVSNDSSVTLREVRVELANLTGGATLAETNALGTNVPAAAGSAGGWSYGTINAGASALHAWKINTDAGADFSFRAVVWASYTRTSYTASDVLSMSEANNAASADAAWSDSAPAWRDACLYGGSPLSINGSSSFGVSQQTPMFPTAIYGSLIQTDGYTNAFVISSAGTFGITSVAGESNDALSGVSVADTTFFPFWDALDGTNGSVCAAIDPSSAAPNRRYVVTWKDMTVRGFADSRVTFSVVLQEKTDNVWFLYHKWLTGADGCSSDGTGSDAVRGAGATVGVRGNGASQITAVSLDTAFLPAHSSTCPGAGAFVSLIATPSNP